MKIIKNNNFDDIKLFSSALWIYEFKFQMISGFQHSFSFKAEHEISCFTPVVLNPFLPSVIFVSLERVKVSTKYF